MDFGSGCSSRRRPDDAEQALAWPPATAAATARRWASAAPSNTGATFVPLKCSARRHGQPAAPFFMAAARAPPTVLFAARAYCAWRGRAVRTLHCAFGPISCPLPPTATYASPPRQRLCRIDASPAIRSASFEDARGLDDANDAGAGAAIQPVGDHLRAAVRDRDPAAMRIFTPAYEMPFRGPSRSLGTAVRGAATSKKPGTRPSLEVGYSVVLGTSPPPSAEPCPSSFFRSMSWWPFPARGLVSLMDSARSSRRSADRRPAAGAAEYAWTPRAAARGSPRRTAEEQRPSRRPARRACSTPRPARARPGSGRDRRPSLLYSNFVLVAAAAAALLATCC